MRKKLITLCLAGAAALTPFSVKAEELIFGTGNVPMNPINKQIMIPWAEKVNAEANGALKINLRHGPMIVNAGNYVDRITDDVVQIAWGMLVFNPGRFPKSLVSTVPFIEGTAEAGALAFCKMYEAGAFGDEFDGLKPLFFVPFPQSSIHLKDAAIAKMEDLAGKKIMVGSPIQSAIVSAFGGTPLSIKLPDQYQSLQRGTADGSFMTFTAFPGFKLDEVTTDHMTASLGGATGMVFMTRKRYDALSEEARAVLDANSGCDVSREKGAGVDKWEQGARGYVMSKGGHTINAISEADFKAMKERLSAPIFSGFSKRVSDGETVLEKWVAAMEAARKETGEIK